MIGYLKGRLVKKQAPHLLLEVQGVGYELAAPMTTFYDLPELGSEVLLHTHLLVREDAHLLYGFRTERDRDLFRTLLKINGVGAKLALALMSGMSNEEMVAALQRDDVDAFIKVPGVGKKTAARLMVELRDRITTLPGGESRNLAQSVPWAGPTDPVSDAVSALIALGYKPIEASRMVRAVSPQVTAVEEIVRQALRNL